MAHRDPEGRSVEELPEGVRVGVGGDGEAVRPARQVIFVRQAQL